MTSGYLADDTANAALFDGDGRVRMPDLATLSPDGYLTISGRVADLIIRGGMNISAAEVEAVLLAHPAVELAAVIGAPHETFGEQVAAFVQLRAGATLTMADVESGHAGELSAQLAAGSPALLAFVRAIGLKSGDGDEAIGFPRIHGACACASVCGAPDPATCVSPTRAAPARRPTSDACLR